MKAYGGTIFLDAGHGGINPHTNKYTTSGKQFNHKGRGIDHLLHNENGDFFEGVSNRLYADILTKKLVEKSINVVPVFHDYLDTSLEHRVAIADMYHKIIQKGIYVSLHHNAISDPRHNAVGVNLYDSVGKTKSDSINYWVSQFLLKNKDNIPGLVFRKIKQRNFAVLRWTDMPAILLETDFFDNYKRIPVITNPVFINNYLQAVADALEYSIQQIYG